jgi:hypothetical protein
VTELWRQRFGDAVDVLTAAVGDASDDLPMGFPVIG